MAGSNLDTEWMFEEDGQVFGPISTRTLLERLYDGSLTTDTRVALEGEDFRALAQIGAFQVHLPKIVAARAEREHARALRRAAARQRWIRGVGWLTAGLLVAGAVSFGVMTFVRHRRQVQAEAERLAKETALQKELETLMASVTIEPPLEALVDGDSGRRRRKGRRSARRARGTLTRKEVLRGVHGVFGALKRCIVAQIQRAPESVGAQIMLTFSIGNDGRAKNVAFEDRFLRRSPMKTCFEQGMRRIEWRTFRGEVRNVQYPISVRR